MKNKKFQSKKKMNRFQLDICCGVSFFGVWLVLTENIAKCKNLRFVTFDRCPKVDDATLVNLHAQLPKIEGFSIRETPKVSKTIIIYLTQHPDKPINIVE